METAILFAAVALAAGTCPTLAWIQRRRGRSACCTPARSDDRVAATADLSELRARRAQIEERIAATEQSESQ